MKKNFSRLCLAMFALFAICCIQGCPRNNEASAVEIRAFRSGDLHMAPNTDAPKTIYIDAGHGAGQNFLPLDTIRNALAAEQFKITDSPSKAGYILHLSILQEGPVDAAMLERLVRSGYGSEARFSGSGGTGLLADALLVQRTVPSASRPSHAKLKNITKRNALDSSQMRLGLLANQNLQDNERTRLFFSEALAKELHAAIVSQDHAAVEEGDAPAR